MRSHGGYGCQDESNDSSGNFPVSPNPVTTRMELMAQQVAERVVALVLDAIDIDALLDRIDVEKLIERVDVEKIIERVDVERIIEQVDVQKIIERVDVNAIIGELDIDALVEQTELGAIIAHSTTGILSEVLDVIRAQGVGLDDFCLRWANRLIGRKVTEWPKGPPLLVEQEAPS